MESTPSYSSEERGTSRDRDGKERSYQPSPPAERFSDPRREEAPRPPRAPLEGVIHIRPAQEAVQTHMQQQFEQAERTKDKDDKRTDWPAPQPQYTEPTAPVEARPATEAPVEAPAFDQQRAEAEPADTESDKSKTERTEPAPQSEQLTAQPDQSQEDATQTPDDFRRTWYYTPPGTPPQPGATELPAPTSYAQEQPLRPAAEATDTLLPEPGASEAWRYDASQAPEHGTEQPVSTPTEADGATAWHYGAEQPAPTHDEQSAPQSWEATDSTPAEETPAPATSRWGNASWFSPRSERTPSEEEPTVELPVPAAVGGGDGPRPPRDPYESSYSYGGGGGASGGSTPTERYTSYSAMAAPTPSARLERLIPHEHAHTHRGLAIGVLGGLLLVHVLSKRRDNKLNERIDQLQKENAEADKQNYWANQELQQTQQALRTEQQQNQAEIAKLREAIPAPEAQQAYVPTAETRADVSGAPAYAAAGVAAAAANKAPQQATQQEQRPAQAPQPEQQPDQQREYVDQQGNPIRTRPGERVKHSEWLTYVEKDGHVVPDAIEYGRAFQEEQHQELGHTPQFDQGAGQGPLFGDQGMYGVHPSLPTGMAGPSLPAGQSTHVDPQHQLPEHTKRGKQIASNVANPWFWLMLALIFAAFFITITV